MLQTGLTCPPFGIISFPMKPKRLLLELWLLIALVGCNLPSSTTTPTGTSTPTLPPGVTPSLTSTPTLTPTPTPVPQVRLESGDQALFNGDFSRARDEYRAAYADSPDPEIRSAALWGLGQVEYKDGNYVQALQALRELVSSNGNSQQVAKADFLLGETYMTLKRYQEASTSYTSYLSLKPGVLDYYIQERIGDAMTDDGKYPAAISAYQAALAALHLGDAFALQVKLAQATASSGDSVTALSKYDDIASRSTNDYLKAQMDLLAGQLLLSLGQKDQAYQRFKHAVDNYPLSYDSYSALVALVNDNIPVDDLNRGIIDYTVKQYGYALDAFNHYLASHPQNDGTVRYYRALTLRDLGNYQEAVDEFSFFINNYPDPGNSKWVDAWNLKAETLWLYLNRYDIAAQTLLNFVSSVPSSASASLTLMDAARIQERGGKLEEAAKTWERVADEYSSSDSVPQALFLAGISRYRLGKFDEALVTFQRDRLLSSTPEDQSRADFWIGKVQQVKGDSNAAQGSWRLAANLDPTGYYSERARDMLLNRPVFDPPPAYDLNFDLASDRKEAESWIRVTFNLPTDTDLSTIGTLGQDPRLVRGTELWNLGLYDEARLEFEDLRNAVSQDPADSYRLANYMLDLGLYRSAITAVRQVLTLAGMDTSAKALTAPNYFNHVRFGVYYLDLVVPAAQEDDLHPLFLFSVMRQESLFEGFVNSNLGARGLMQILPATGAEIANKMDWPLDYTADDLYRPLVSVYLGAYYLMSNRISFDGDLYSALAAYHAGPGSSDIWKGLAGNDPDLFVEIVRYQDTRDYIRSIYENFVIYRSLYGKVP